MEVNGQLHSPATFTLGKNPDTRWEGVWVTPELVQSFWRREKSLGSVGIKIPDSPAHSLVTVPATLPQLIRVKSINVKRNTDMI